MDDKKKTDATTEEAAAVERVEGTDLPDTEEQPDREDQEGGEERGGEEENLVLKFKKPYVFEGKEYTELDLSGLEDTKEKDLEAVAKAVAKKNPGLNAASVEMTMAYSKMLAQRVTKKPLEFFERLPAKEAMNLKGIVVGFLFGGDGEN